MRGHSLQDGRALGVRTDALRLTVSGSLRMQVVDILRDLASTTSATLMLTGQPGMHHTGTARANLEPGPGAVAATTSRRS